MEKLRKALDRAREARGQEGATIRALIPHTAAHADSREVSYTRTRVFTPAPEQLNRSRILVPGSPSHAADAFKMLRTQVAQRMSEHGWRSLAVCSPRRGEGRTVVAVNLAIALAADPRYSVLLCDLDLREPTIAGLFGDAPSVGINDVLAGSATVEECLVHPQGFDGLVVLPARAALAGSSEYLASAVTSDVISELRARYPDRILIFDLPPVLAADDALAFSPNVECALLVVDEGTTRRADVTRTLEVLTNTPVIGTLLNRSLAGSSAVV